MSREQLGKNEKGFAMLPTGNSSCGSMVTLVGVIGELCLVAGFCQ